jgi:hypothetical protein
MPIIFPPKETATLLVQIMCACFFLSFFFVVLLFEMKSEQFLKTKKRMINAQIASFHCEPSAETVSLFPPFFFSFYMPSCF